MGGGELVMERFIQEFVYGFISLGEFKDKVISYLVNDWAGGEMEAEVLRQYGKAMKLLCEEIINEAK